MNTNNYSRADLDDLSGKVIGCAIEVHRLLGPGLLESSHHACLCKEMDLQEIPFNSEVALPVDYKGLKLDCGYRLDLLVGKELIVELKSVQRIEPIHEAQILTYLRLSGIRTGMILNFNVPLLKDGIRRFVI